MITNLNQGVVPMLDRPRRALSVGGFWCCITVLLVGFSCVFAEPAWGGLIAIFSIGIFALRGKILGFSFSKSLICSFVSVFSELAAYDYVWSSIGGAEIDIVLYFQALGVLVLIGAIFSKKDKQLNTVALLNKDTRWAISILLLYIFLVAIAAYLGVGVMGVMDVALPFKLTGIINVLKSLLPMLIFVPVCSMFARNSPAAWWVFFSGLIVAFIDGYFKLSKGVVLTYLFPYVVYLFLYRFSIKVLVIGLMVTVLGLFVFSGVERLRDVYYDTGQYDLNAALDSSLDIYRADDSMVWERLKQRVFMGPFYLEKFKQHEGGRAGEEFDKIYQNGGAAKYHTRIIAGVDERYVTSYGASGVSSFYLYFGIWGQFIFALFVAGLCCFLDFQFKYRNVPFVHIFFLIIMLLLYVEDTADFIIMMDPYFLGMLLTALCLLWVNRSRKWISL